MKSWKSFKSNPLPQNDTNHFLFKWLDKNNIWNYSIGFVKETINNSLPCIQTQQELLLLYHFQDNNKLFYMEIPE